MEITPFGALVVLAGVALLARRREWLLAMLPVCAVLQAPAALIVGSGDGRLGITPFNIAVGFCGIALLLEMRSQGPRKILRGVWQEEHRLWTLFLVLAAVAAWVLPVLFEGVAVHPLFAKSDVAVEPLPNRLSVSHVAQSVNSIGLIVVLAWAAAFEDRRVAARALWTGLFTALAVSVAVSVYHRGALLGYYELAVETWGSNPSYNQYFTSKYGPGYGRASLPFTEPSYASVWFAAMASAALAAAASRLAPPRARALYAGAALLALAALANTLGTSGLAAFALALPMVLCLLFVLRYKSVGLRAALSVLVAASLAIAIAAFLVVDYQNLHLAPLAPVREAIDFTLLKISWAPFGPRVWSTHRALAIVIETWGLGVGPGSTRTSSYLVGLLANMGFLGAGLFLLALLRQLRWLWCRAMSRDVLAVGLFAATVTGAIGVFGGIPDQNWPVVWVFLIAGTLVVGPAAAAEKSRRGAKGAQHLSGDGNGRE